MTDPIIMLTRTCTVEAEGRRPLSLAITVERPIPEPELGIEWIAANIVCGEYEERLRAPGKDPFEALTGILQRVADRLLQIAQDNGIDIYWREKGDLEAGNFWGQPFAPWEIAVRSRLAWEFREQHPDLPRIVEPSARVAIDEGIGSVHIFRVMPDGTDSLNHTISAETVSSSEPDALAQEIGQYVLWQNSFGRRLYGHD